MNGRIHSIETFGTVDGPGIRYVIFMQGCTFRCAYCHNPDTWELKGGQVKSTDDLFSDISRYLRYISGVTVTGGEPLLQIDFLIELFEKVRKLGISTCIDTSGGVFDKSDSEYLKKVDKLLRLTDLVLLDIKHIDEVKHINLVGKSNQNVLDFAKYLDKKKVPVWLRYVLVPGINDDMETLLKWKSFADGLRNVQNIEVLPYHRMGVEKYKKLGIPYKFENISVPTNDQVADINILFNRKGKKDNA